MTWHPISEPPPHPERPHTAMLRRTDHECVCLLPGPVMWDASTRRWTRESGAPIRFDADAEYHWRDEEDILADPRLAHLADGAPLATDTQEYLTRGERPASHRKFVIEADHTAMYSDGRTEWNTRLVSLESAPRAPSQVTEPLAVPVTESPNPAFGCLLHEKGDNDMTAMQRRLHHAACVLDGDGDEWGGVGILRSAIDELERYQNQVSVAKQVVTAGVALMHHTQVGEWAGVRSFLEQETSDYEPFETSNV